MENKNHIQLKGRLGNFVIDCYFTPPTRGVSVIFGPSGCGKTSILRAIAGLNRLQGQVIIAGEIWQNEKIFKPVYHRPIGYVFQEASLFVHLSVKKNLLFGAKKSGDQQTIQFDEVVDLLNIGHFINRSPHDLSGGERQRVAIGRALLSNPRLLLMDEPLSALDQKNRDEIMPFLLRLREQLHLPIFYITHDMAEVEKLADYLLLMDNGKNSAQGPLENLQSNPDLPLSNARNAAVSLDGMVIAYDENSKLLSVKVGNSIFLAPAKPLNIGTYLRLHIGARDVSITLEKPQKTSILNIVPATIIAMREKNEREILCVLQLSNQNQSHFNAEDNIHILSRISRHSWQELHLSIGAKVYAQIKGVSLIARF